MHSTTKRTDRREYRVSMFDGRAAATVYVVDGYGRPVSHVVHVSPVRSVREAIAAAVAAGMESL